MKYISIIICLALFSCHDVKVGYLETEVAQYNPNVLEVTKSQDANEPLHVVSPPIEGVEGTQPIYITIRQVTTTDGDKVAFLKEVTVRGRNLSNQLTGGKRGPLSHSRRHFYHRGERIRHIK